MKSGVRRYALVGVLAVAAVSLTTTTIWGATFTSLLGERQGFDRIVLMVWNEAQAPASDDAFWGRVLNATGRGLDRASVSTPATPEPVTLLLLAVALSGAAAYLRRRLGHGSASEARD